METDRHGYCEHNRRPPKCWECQVDCASKAERKVEELEEEAEKLRDHSQGLSGMLDEERRMYAVALRKSTTKVEELQAQLDRATKPRPMSEAPRDGTEFWAMRKASWVVHENGPIDHIWCHDECVPASSFDGWLPTASEAPGGSEEGE